MKPTWSGEQHLSRAKGLLSQEKGKEALSNEPRGPPCGCLPKQFPYVRNEDSDYHELLLILGKIQ